MRRARSSATAWSRTGKWESEQREQPLRAHAAIRARRSTTATASARHAGPVLGTTTASCVPSMGTYPLPVVLGSPASTPSRSPTSIAERARARRGAVALRRTSSPTASSPTSTFWQREAFEEMLKTYSIAYRTPYLSDCIQPPVLAEAVQAAARGREATRLPGRGSAEGAAVLRLARPRARSRPRRPHRHPASPTNPASTTRRSTTPTSGIHGTDLEDYTTAWERVAGPVRDRRPRSRRKMFALDRFICEDVLVNTIYGENQRVLGELLESVGDARARRRCVPRAAHTTEAPRLEVLRRGGAGCSSTWPAGARSALAVNTVSSLLPALACPTFRRASPSGSWSPH